MSPKISVITVCRNESKRIKETLESVISQTYRDFQYIVIDGNSTDGTVDIIKSYAKDIHHFVSENDHGIYNAMNKALKIAKGEYVLFLNGGDSLCNPNVFQKIFSNSSENADIIYGDIWIESDSRSAVRGRSPENISLGFLFYSTLWHPASFIKRSLFETYGLYDESLKLVADYDFFLKVLGKHKVTSYKIAIEVARFNTQGAGSDPKNAQQILNERLQAQKKYFNAEVIQLGQDYSSLMNELSLTKSSIGYRFFNFIARRFA